MKPEVASKNMTKFISTVLALLLFLEAPLFAGVPVSSVPSVSENLVKFKQQFLDQSFNLERDKLSENSSKKPICILIGDAHGSGETQDSIFKFIEWLRKEQSGVLFLMEGVHGGLSLKGFEDNKNQKQKELIENLFKQGELSPIETSFLLHPGLNQAFGLESSDWYERNIKAYWKTKSTQIKAETVFETLFTKLGRQLSKEIPADLLNLNSIESFLGALHKSPESTVKIFTDAFHKIQLEKINRFNERFPAVHVFFSILETFANQAINEQVKELIENPEFIEQLGAEYAAFYEFLTFNSNSTALWHSQAMLRRLLLLEATPEDAAIFRNTEKRDELMRLIQKVGSDFLSHEEIHILMAQFDLSEKFYALAFKRDAIFKAAFNKTLNEHPDVKAVVVAMGGFHMAEFQKFLSAHNYPYLVMKPKMAHPSETSYELQMKKLASLQSSTVSLPIVLEENDYALAGLVLPGRRAELLVNLSSAKSELRVDELASSDFRIRRRMIFGIGKALAALPFSSLISGCAETALNWQKTPAQLISDRGNKARQEVLVIPEEIETGLRDSNPAILQRLQVKRAYYEWLKTLPEFANIDLNLAFETQLDKVIGSINRGKVSKKERFLREQLNELATSVIGSETGKIAENLSAQNEKLGELATSLGDAVSQGLSEKILPGDNPDPVNYDPVWGDLGINLGFTTSPALSALDVLGEYLEKNPAVPLVSLNTPFGFSLGPSSSNIAQASFNKQVALNLLKEIVQYRRVLDDQTRGVIQTYQALDAANIELMRLVADAHLLTLQFEQFKGLRFGVSKNQIKQLELEIKKTSHLINVQLRAISILQGSLDLFFTRSTKDERTWVIQSGAGERSAFTAKYNLFTEPVRGMNTLPQIPFMVLEQNVYHLDPNQMPVLVDRLIQKGVLDAGRRDWFMSWVRHQTSLAGKEIPREAIQEMANFTIGHSPDIAATEAIRIDISLTQENIRQIRLGLHPEVTFGVDSGFTASPIDKVNTWTWNIPLALSIRFPISTSNTQVSIRQGEVDIEISQIAIDEALKIRKDTVGTLQDTIAQTDETLQVLTAQQGQQQIDLSVHGRTREDYRNDGSQPIPSDEQIKFFPLVRQLLATRIQLHGVESANYWTYRLLGTYANGRGHHGPEYPDNELSNDVLDPNVKRVVEEGLRPLRARSELRSVENESEVVSQIEERLNLYKEILPDEGEIKFGGTHLEFKKDSENLKLTKAGLPLLKYFELPVILIFIEEYFHEMAIGKHSEGRFSGKREEDYALLQHSLFRITKRLFSENKETAVAEYLPASPEDSFAVLRVLQNSVQFLIQEGKARIDDGKIHVSTWAALKKEAEQEKPVLKTARVVYVPASEETPNTAAEKVKPVIVIYRTALYGGVGLGEAAASLDLLNDFDAVDSEQRGIFGFIRDFAASAFPANIVELLRFFKAVEVKELTQTHEIALERLDQEVLSLYRKGDVGGAKEKAALPTASTEITVQEPAEMPAILENTAEQAQPVIVQDPAEQIDSSVVSITPIPETEEIQVSAPDSTTETAPEEQPIAADVSKPASIVSLGPVSDNLTLTASSNLTNAVSQASSTTPQRPSSIRQAVVNILAWVAILVTAALSISFAQPVLTGASKISAETMAQVIQQESQETRIATTQQSVPAPVFTVWKQAVKIETLSAFAQKPWFVTAAPVQLELNPKFKNVAADKQLSVSELTKTLKIKSDQIVVYAVQAPDFVQIEESDALHTIKTSSLSLEAGLSELAKRFEAMKQTLIENDPVFARDDSASFPVPFDIEKFIKIVKENKEALIHVSPFQNGAEDWRGTAIPWSKLFSDAASAIARAERELDTFTRGDSSSGDFRIFLLREAYPALQKLAESIERYQNTHRLVIPRDQVERLGLSVSDFSLSGPVDSKSGSSFVQLKLKDADFKKLKRSKLVVKLKNGKLIEVSASQLDWVRADGDLYFGFFSSTDINRSDISSAFIQSDSHNEDSDEALISPEYSEASSITIPRGFEAELKVPYFSKVKTGDIVAEIYDPLVAFRIQELDNQITFLNKVQKALKDLLTNIPADVIRSKYGLSLDDFDKNRKEIELEKEALIRQSSKISLKARQSGLFLPPDGKASQLLKIPGDEYLIGFIAPSVEADQVRSELRREKTVSQLRELVLPKSELNLKASLPADLNQSPFSDIFSAAAQRSSFVKALNRFPGVRAKLRETNSSNLPAQTGSTLLITDANSFSAEGFQNWKQSLPPSSKLHWIIVANREEISRSELRKFVRELNQTGYYPMIVETREEALKRIGQQAKLWRPELVKWVTSDRPEQINVNPGGAQHAFITMFDARIYGELEGLFFESILRAESPQALMAQYSSIRSKQNGAWFVLEFNFENLLSELAGAQLPLRSA